MKRIPLCLCTAFLLLAGLCGQSAHAAYTQYTPSAALGAPTNGATYTVYSPNATAQVPATITNQWVDVSGADPSSTVTFAYSMSDYAAKRMYGGGPKPIFVADDWSDKAPILMDKDGHWRRYVNGGSTGYISTTFGAAPGGYSFTSESIIEDAQGDPYISSQSVEFTVDQAV